MKGMSDWNLTELEDIDWDEFGKSEDHIVPRRGDKLSDHSLTFGDSHKKLRHEMKNDAGKSMYSKGSSAKTVLLGKDDTYRFPIKAGSLSTVEGSQSQASNIEVPDCNGKGTAFPSQDMRIFDYCVNESITDTSGSIFCSKDPRIGTRVSTHGESSGLSSLNGVSSDVTDLSFLDNEQKHRDNDLVYYDWPVISNFEDIDEMLSWDSTFGQGQIGTADELSWFPSSSNTNYSSEIAFEPGVQSPSSELGALHAKFAPPNVVASADHDKPCSSTKAKPANKEKIESQQLLEGKGTNQSTDQLFSDSDLSALQMYSSQQFSQQKHLIGSSASYTHTLDRHSQLEFGFPTHQVPLAETASSVEVGEESQPSSSYKFADHFMSHPNQCLEGLPEQLYMARTMAPKDNIATQYQNQQPAFRSKASNQKKQLEAKDDTEMENIDVKLTKFEIDHPISQEVSGMSSFCSDGISEKAPSFLQLQDAIHQLDVRTKLCIRDSLYRLARSARQRHSLTTQICSGGTIDTIGNQGTEASSKSVDFIDVETNTNPIDRSIAHLLFHRPSAPTTRSVDDTISLESRIMNQQVNQQVHVPLTAQVSAPNQFDHEGFFGGCNDMDTDLP